MFFILNSVWANQIYYMFGFVFLIFLLFTLTVSETTVLLVYMQLCSEVPALALVLVLFQDYRWYWRSFFAAASTALYMLLYCFHYFLRLDIIDVTSVVLYSAYSCILAFLFALLSGSIGFFSSYVFVHKIYSSVKVD